MPIAAFGLFALAHAVLFQLYLPQRYTYPLVPFFSIAIGVLLRPTFESLGAHRRLALVAAPLFGLGAAVLALTAFPLGPRLSLWELGHWLMDAAPLLSLGLVVGIVLAAVARRRTATPVSLGAATALVTASVLTASLAFSGGGQAIETVTCDEPRVYRFLRSLPEDTVVAADPFVSNCIPLATGRPVVVSRKLYQPWALDFFESIRERMFLTVDAFYGSSVDAVIELRERYGADYLVVRKGGDEPTWAQMEPFTSEVKRLRVTTSVPAVERLADRCLAQADNEFQVYRLDCVARAP